MSYQIEMLLIHPKYSSTGSYKIRSLSLVLTFSILSPLLTAFWPHQTSISSSKTCWPSPQGLCICSFFCFYSAFPSEVGFSFQLISEEDIIILELYISFIEHGKWKEERCYQCQLSLSKTKI